MSLMRFMALALVFVAGGLVSYIYVNPPVGEPAAVPSAEKPLYWVAPMDASYRRDGPGKSPMGMDLVPVYREGRTEEEPGTVRISPAVAANLGVKLGQVTVSDLSRRIETVGFIQFDEQSINHIHSRVEGWIENLSVTAVGDSVSKGQQLFLLYSPELVNAQEELVAELKADNRALLKGAVRKLKALGVSDEVITRLKRERRVFQQLPYVAANDGYIATLNVREGAYIRPETEVLSVGGLQRVWVMADIFERQSAWVRPGQRVSMTTEAFPGEQWHGVVDYVHPTLDAMTRTLRARIVFENRDQRLKPNMFARLAIDAGTSPSVLTVPRQAVIHQGGSKRVVKRFGDTGYRSVAVETGLESGDRVEIKQGLEPGDRVVISSQFLIDSESSVSAELLRLDGGEDKQEAPEQAMPHQDHHHHQEGQ